MVTILAVDDEPANRALLVQLVRHAGHAAMEAADGPSALRALRECTVDLAIVDLSLPGMSGAELLKTIRADPALHALPVVLSTATPRTPAMDDFMLLLGIRYFIPKPCDPHEILEIVRRAVRDL